MKCAVLLGLCFLAWACEFNPVVRTPKPQRLSDRPSEVLSMLDARGEYALLAYQGDDGAAHVAISRWREHERCDVPVLSEPIAAPLPRAQKAPSQPALYVPVALSEGEGNELWLVDERCNLYGPLGAIDPDSARTVISARDGGGYLLYRDDRERLTVLDPRRGLEPLMLADRVGALRAALEPSGKRRDVVWMIRAARLTLMTLDGSTLVSMGDDVTAMTLASDASRVAFIDGGDLYEAVAPEFEPSLVAEDACSARYGGDTLDFLAPCDQQALRRVSLSSGKYQTFHEGVFASRTQEGVQLDYSSDPSGEDVLTASYRNGERALVEPTFHANNVYVIDEQQIAGVVDGDRFGVWQRRDATFSPMIERVAEVIPHHRGKKHSFAWLVYHDVEHALGTLTLIDHEGVMSEIARSVPLPAQQGFVVENGSALASYPFSAPLVVLLEEAEPADADLLRLGTTSERIRFCGRLKALAITGAPRAILAENVCSYAIVAAPVPGVLYGVESGEEQGLWFVAL
jgi:hypothetical protein